MDKHAYQLEITEVLDIFKTDGDSGLESSDADKRHEEQGPNALEEKKGKSTLKMVIEQIADFMIIILIIASALSIIVGELIDGIVILLIVVLNAILGVTQEKKAGEALAALKKLSAPKAKVIRNGSIQVVDAPELVTGDVVKLEAGDYVPADVRLIEAVNLKIDESALTGESVPVDKVCESIADVSVVGDRLNMGHMSTVVTYGRGTGVVTSIGMGTEIGKIATLLSEEEDSKTPLQEKLTGFGKMLGIACLVIGIIIIILGLVREDPLLLTFMTAISLAVAAIPEGMPAVVTVVLAIGVTRMVKRNVIMKNLSAVETLGSTTVICSDKTGTLTQNKMTVTHIFYDNKDWTPGNEEEKEALTRLIEAAVLCNDSVVSEDGTIVGEPTENALAELGISYGIDHKAFKSANKRVDEFPFDSSRKMMSTMHESEDDYVMYTKGALDNLLQHCSHILTGNGVGSLDEGMKQALLEQNSLYAENALRVLGLAYKEVSANADPVEEEKEGLVYCGMVGMIDPPRDEAKDAIQVCKKAGMRAIMITGDHIVTASAIARELGIIESSEQALEGKAIDGMSDEALSGKVAVTNVFARVSPEHKVRIVDAFKRNGEIAAMTGDGVNDAPALKRADIGVAMGITGTDVSKEAADMVLTDDNFASIVAAVEEGRIIYSNIRKFVSYLLSCNIGEILVIFVAMLIGWPVPLLPIQILWINLLTDSLPAFALGLEEGEKDIMNFPPRDPKEPIANKKMRISMAYQSIALAIAVLSAYRLGFYLSSSGDSDTDLAVARTLCFAALILGEMFRAYSARSENHSLFRMKIFSNKFLNLSVLGATAMLMLVIYVPFLQPFFNTVYIPPYYIGIIIGFSLLPMLAGELAKLHSR